MQQINCFKCIHYYITWDPARPKGCRHFGFKSTQLPSIVVYKSSGEPCQAFQEKRKK